MKTFASRRMSLQIITFAILGIIIASLGIKLYRLATVKSINPKLVLLQQFNSEVIPLYRTKAEVIKKHLHTSETQFSEIHSIIQLTRQWSAKSEQDVATMTELMGYLDSHVSKKMTQLDKSQAKALYSELEPIDSKIRSIEKQRLALNPAL